MPPLPSSMLHGTWRTRAVFAVLLAGCGGGADTGADTAAARTGSTRDSAGVTIVEHDDVPSGLPRWTILDSAEVRIGALDGSGPQVFGRIAGLARLSNGSIVVAEAQALQLRAFDTDGRHLWTAGQRGEGPGEFMNTITRLSPWTGDSLLASDGNGRPMLFAPDGTYQRLLRLPEPAEGTGRPRIVGVLGDGTPVLVAPVIDARLGSGDIPAGITRGRERLATLAPSGALSEPLGELRSREATIAVTRNAAGAITSMGVRLLTMGRSSAVAVGTTSIVEGETDAFALRHHDQSSGRTTIIRVDLPLQATDEAVRRLTAAMDSNAVVPDSLPAFGAVRVDDADRIWVQEFVPVYEPRAPQWWVLDSRGAFIARVEAPRGFDPLAFSGEQVWGVRLDEFDVPYVERHRIVR